MSHPDPFERWLQQRLCRLYDPVLREPLPESLRQLLDEAATPRAAPPGNA